MEKCFQMSMVKAGAGVIHQTHSPFASTKAPVKPSFVTPPSATRTFNRRGSFIACNYSVNEAGHPLKPLARPYPNLYLNACTFLHGFIGFGFFDFEVEVVTACSWTELVVAADMPVLVEFWVPSSGPSWVIDEVAKEYAGRALCYKLNIDDYPNVALQYGITSIPCVLFYMNGEKKDIIIGDISKSTLCATLDKYLC